MQEVPLPDGFSRPVKADRSIPVSALDKYKVLYNPAGDMLTQYFTDNIRTSWKISKKELKANGKKHVISKGSLNSSEMFGQQEFREGGKFLTITEGERDATSAFTMHGSKYACVSVNGGASNAKKNVMANLEWASRFDTVIIDFDSDIAGKKAAKEVASLFEPGTARIVGHTVENMKDANDYLNARKISQYTNDWWGAKRFQPEGIVNLADVYNELMEDAELPSIPYPWAGLNDTLDGIRSAELVTITSGSGMGKSQIIRELEYHLLTNTTDNIGILALEEDTTRTAWGLMSVAASLPLHRKKYRDDVPPEVIQEAFQKTCGTGRLHTYDHFGSTASDTLFDKIRFMIKGLGCRFIILDHLSIVVSSQEEDGDERRLIDKVMTKLRTLVQETGVSMFLVSHLRRASGDKGHEGGESVSLSQLRGSQSIAQLSDAVIALERNQQATNTLESNLSILRVLKSRYTGVTGIACYLAYDVDTGRMTEVDSEDLDEYLAGGEPTEGDLF